MSISYPVDVANTLWAVARVSDGAIIARNKLWPVADGGPIPGFDANYAYLLQIDMAPPDHDPRLYYLEIVETADIPANTLTSEYTAVPRPVPERTVAAENEEAVRFSNFVTIEREVIETRLMVGAILNFVVNQQQFPPKVQTMADAYVTTATKLWNNRDRLKEIITAIEAQDDPDLDDWPE